MATCYVIYLWGDDVFSGMSLKKVITNVDMIDDAISSIAETYNLEFILFQGDTSIQHYRNITDDRDISIIVEKMRLE